MQRDVGVLSKSRAKSLTGGLILLLVGAVWVLPAGCGTDFSELAVQAGSSAAFTILDIFLTDTANALLDQQSAEQRTGGDDEDNADDDVDDNDGAGAVSSGEAAYIAQDCAACHGGDAEGASAPALAGMDESAALEDRFGGGAGHFGRSLTDQEIVDLAAWLLGDDTGGGGAEAAGREAYAVGTCTACHGAEGEGGVGPALAGMDEADALADRFGGGASHNGNELTDQEISDVAVWLASL